MRKYLLFSILSTCLCTWLIAAADNNDRADDNEYDLFERNEDHEDFDPYNFPENSDNQSENMRHWSKKEGNMLRRETKQRTPEYQYRNYTTEREEAVCPHCHQIH